MTAPTPTPRTPTVTAPVTPTVPPPNPVNPQGQGTRSAGGTNPGGTSDGIFDRWGNLPGVGVSWTGPGGPRTAVSDANGAVSLGPLKSGVHEVTVSTRITSTGGPQPGPQMVLIGLLLPAVQAAREAKALEVAIPANSGDRRIRIGVDSRGQVTSVDWGDGKGPASVNVAAADVNGDGRPDLATGRRQYQPLLASARDQTHLVFGTASGPGTAGGPQNAPVVTSRSNKKHGLSTGGLTNVGTTWSGPGGQGRAMSDGTGAISLGRLPQGKYDVAFEFPKTGGGQPGQQRVLIGLLLPAVQAVRGVEVPFSPGAKGLVKLDVGPGGDVVNATWTWRDGGILAQDDWEANRLTAAPAGPGETKLVFSFLSSSEAGVGGSPGTPGGPQNAPINVARDNKRHGLPNVGVSASGPGGVMQVQTDGSGVARLGRLPMGSTTVELDGNQLRSTVSGPGAPGQPAGLRGGFVIPAIAIIAVRIDGQPTVAFLPLPAGTIPGKVRAIVRVGRDNNVMDVDWGKGPQPVKAINTYTGATTVNAGTLKAFEDLARAGKPGDVLVALEEANNLLMEVSTTR